MAKLDEKKLVYMYHRIPAEIGIHKDGLVEITIEGKLLQLTKNQFNELINSRLKFMHGV